MSDTDHTTRSSEADWQIFARTNEPDPLERLKLKNLPAPPKWRTFGHAAQPEEPDAFASRTDDVARGVNFVCSEELAEAVNAALYLRRPLLLTGKPGTGKSTLIYAVARELRLGPVLRWAVTSRTTLRDGLYQYDALGRLHDRPRANGDEPDRASRVRARARSKAAAENIGRYVELGPLGTALYPTRWPRALLIDEIDKSDLDLPNDLLNVFEEGEVHIPELARASESTIHARLWRRQERVPITAGKFLCEQFPFVVLTSNGERTFPAPFLRRCIQFTIPEPTSEQLTEIVTGRLGTVTAEGSRLIGEFEELRKKGDLATDQLLNAIFLTLDSARSLPDETRARLHAMLLRELGQIESS